MSPLRPPNPHPPQTPGSLDDPAFVLYLLRHLLTTRAVEERSVRNSRLGIQPKFFSAWGNEATAVGTAAALRPHDVLVPMHRSLGAHLVRGHSLYDVFLQAFLKADSQTRGRDTGLHLGRPGTNIVGMISPLGSMNVVAAGVAYAEKYLGRDSVVLAYIGDGGAQVGVVHEALNFIGVHKLPVVTVIENNQWAYGTPNRLEFPTDTLAERGPAYGMPGRRIDGTSLPEVYEATREGVERARRGEGPALIESVTMRMRGHAEHDNQHYVPKGLLEDWAKKDPVDRFVAWVAGSGLLPELDVDAMKKEIDAEVLAASDRAQAAPEPEPRLAKVGLFAGDGDDAPPDNDSTPSLMPDAATTRRQAEAGAVRSSSASTRKVTEIPTPGTQITYLQAIRECVRLRLKQDPRLLVFGEDIGIMGGAFQLTEGFLDEFGPQRVVDMPIAENAISGACMGVALRGLRSVCEMQFSDFVASTFNELVNNAGTFRWRIGSAVPFVMRLPAGGSVAAGPFHSLDPEAWFAHTPGLRVVVPATVEDAWGLMNAALDSEDPVLFLEQKYLYRRLKAPCPAWEHSVEIGRARIARPGKDTTVVTWGNDLELALAAAERLAADGKGDVEVVDLRSIAPWDKEAVAGSVRKTSRLLVLHEARRTCGFGAEVAAWATEELFEWLDAPVRRIAALDVPSPSHKALEQAVIPQVQDVVEGLDRLIGW